MSNHPVNLPYDFTFSIPLYLPINPVFRYQIKLLVTLHTLIYIIYRKNIGVRVTGTPAEIVARDYVVEQFEDMGYDVEIQPFTFDRRGVTYESANVIATKQGKIGQTVIIGAHYDSVREEWTDCEDPCQKFLWSW